MSDITSQTSQPSVDDVTTEEEGRAVQSTHLESGSIAKLLSETTGRVFKNDEDALRSVGETFRFVGDTGSL